MTTHRIHVNQAIIKKNHKSGENNPVLTVKSGKLNRYAHEVVIWGRPGSSTPGTVLGASRCHAGPESGLRLNLN